MNLQVSVVLLFISLTGGYSLKCYFCTSDSSGTCALKEETCAVGASECLSVTVQQSGFSTVSTTTKTCALICVPGTAQLPTGGTATVSCCNTDLCNAADGVYKGSFLFLVSPLLFYFLFQ